MSGVDWLQVWAFMQTIGWLLVALALMLLVVLVALADVYVVKPLVRWWRGRAR